MGIFKKTFKKIKLFFNIGNFESNYNYTAEHEIVNSIADRIATQASKLQPQVIRKDAKGTQIKNDKLSRLLTLRPCAECNTVDFLYKIVYDAVSSGDGFAVVFYNSDFTEIIDIKPINCNHSTIFEDENSGNLFFRFIWSYDRKEYTIPYQFVIHLKERYNRKRFLGSNPYNEIDTSIDLLNTTYTGIKNIVKNTASLRGYLKYSNFSDDEDLKEKAREFQEAYMKADNEGGIAALDSSYDFKELSNQQKQIPITQVNHFRENIYRYFGMSEKIISGNYSEADWGAFYESKVEPLAIKLSLEFTFKIFTERERGFGNKIVFTANRLQYATTQTKITAANDMFDRGVITLNEYREIMDMPTISDGDVRMISLNYVKVDEQSQYQLNNKNQE